MSKIIERIARAVCISRGIDPDRKVSPQHPEYIIGLVFSGAYYAPNDSSVYPAWQFFATDVRTMLDQLREPTSEMCADGANSADDLAALGAKHVWCAMVEAALR